MKFFILPLVFLFVFSCGEQEIKPIVNNSILSENPPVQESWNSKIYFSEGSDLKAVLYTDYLAVYENPKQTLLEGVRIDFYNEEGEKTSTLTSKKGKVDDVSRNMFAIDSVVAVSDSGVTLTTEELIWKKRERKITTDKFVRIVSNDEIIEGYGLDSDQSLSNYTIYNITYYSEAKTE